MRKASLIVGLIGCIIGLIADKCGPALSSLGAAQTKEAKKDDAKQSSEPTKEAKKESGFEKKKSPFGAKPKMPVGKELLETKRPFVKAWKVDDLLKKLDESLTKRDFERGKKLYSEAKCVLCHTYGKEEGGFIGPALTDVGARFSAADILNSIIEPNKIIADAYAQRVVELEDGRVFTGMIVELDDEVQITPDILDPNRKILVSQDKVSSMQKSDVSPMPEGMINVLNQEEIFDLIAFVISRNDPEDEMFTRKPAPAYSAPP